MKQLLVTLPSDPAETELVWTHCGQNKQRITRYEPLEV